MSAHTLFNAQMPKVEVSSSSLARRLFLRIVFEIGAIILLLLGVPLLLFVFLFAPFPYVSFFYMLVASVVFFKLVRKVRRKGKQYSAARYTTVDGGERLLRDKRRPILYLRSFLEEYPHNSLRDDLRTDEELLNSVLTEIGPMVAIGRPKEPLPLLGASRFYFADDEWQTEVTRLMQRAQFVVIKPGLAKNLEWEIETAAKDCSPQKLLFPLLEYQAMSADSRERNYKLFKRIIENKMGVTLPADIGTATFLFFGNEDGKTVPLFSWPLTGTDKRQMSLFERFLGEDRVPLTIREALRPVMARHGIQFGEWARVRDICVAVSIRLLLISIIVLLFAGWIAVTVYYKVQNSRTLISRPRAVSATRPGQVRGDGGRRSDYPRPDSFKTRSTAFATRSTGTRRMHSGASNSAQA